MAEFHNTMMGKQFITSTIPQLVRAVEKLNKNLTPEPIVEYETKIAMLYVNEGGRRELEDIEVQKFDTLQAVLDVNEEIAVYGLSDFTEMLNNNDSECDDVHIQDRWIGYIELKKNAINEHRAKENN